MTVSLSHVHVIVDDIDQAITFYRDHLGLSVVNEVEYDSFRWITLTPPAQPDVQIVLSEPHAGRSQEDGDAIAALLAKGVLGMINFRTDDLDATFERVLSAPGMEVLQEPAEQPWGDRDAGIRDPAGNHIRLAQA